MIKENSSLKKFRHIHCPDEPIDSLHVFYKLLNAIKKSKEEKKGSESIVKRPDGE